MASDTSQGRTSGDLASQTKSGYVVRLGNSSSPYAPGTAKVGMIEGNPGGGVSLPGGSPSTSSAAFRPIQNRVGAIVKVRG